MPLILGSLYRHSLIVKELSKQQSQSTLPPFSTTVVKGNTKFKSHGIRLNLIAESPNGTQLPSGIQCTPTYCTMEPGSSRVSVGLRNLSARSITIPSHSVVGHLQQATIQKVHASESK